MRLPLTFESLPILSSPSTRLGLLAYRGFSTSPSVPSKAHDPLRILFCGSDEFSIASLRALHEEHIRNTSLIQSIEVACRPGKRTGRGLKEIREVPIQGVAEQLTLPVHQIDTFKGWSAPLHINLILAVSFGLLIPARVIEAAKYGGLNVHPSLLPDLRGAAPVHHALLHGDTHTGISVQTLHPSRFDAGTILSQTEPLRIHEPATCAPEGLIKQLAPIGGQMLVETLKKGKFLPPITAVKANAEGGNLKGLRHAPKITKEMGRIGARDGLSAEDVLQRTRVLGSLWSDVLISAEHRDNSTSVASHPNARLCKRVRWEEWEPAKLTEVEEAALVTDSSKDTRIVVNPDSEEVSLIFGADGTKLRSRSCTIDGGKKGRGIVQLKRMYNESAKLSTCLRLV